MKPSVTVFLSIWRGRAHLKQQVESIRNQVEVEVKLLFHMDEDDEVAERLVYDAFPGATRALLPPGLGLPEAYLRLIAAPTTHSDFWAFADQDDVWLPNKLKRAATELRKMKEPALWIGGSVVIDSVGKLVVPNVSLPRSNAQPSFGNALVETVAPGCAMVWNSTLQNRIQFSEIPTGAVMHDSWVYLLACTFGRVVIDSEPTIHYRLHTGNSVGLARDVSSRLRRLGGTLRRSRRSVRTQACDLVCTFSEEMSASQVNVAETVARGNFWKILSLVARGKLRRTSFVDQGFLPVWIIMHRRARQC